MARLKAEEKLASLLRETDNLTILDQALLRLYGKQTSQERRVRQTYKRNCIGFDRNMAPTMSQFAEKLLAGTLTNKHRRMMRRILPGYATQLRDLALELGIRDD